MGKFPTNIPTSTEEPTLTPTKSPTASPTHTPTEEPTPNPTQLPTRAPTESTGMYLAGTKVMVQWSMSVGGDDRWYPGEVLSCTARTCKVKFDDGAASRDEPNSHVHLLVNRMNERAPCNSQCAAKRNLGGPNAAMCTFCGRTGYCCAWGDYTDGCWGTAGRWDQRTCLYK